MTGAGVGTRSVEAGAGIGEEGVGVGCACDGSDDFEGDADPGFAGREGWRVLPPAAAEALLLGLFCSTAASCEPGVDVGVPTAAALAPAAATRSAWRARAFLRISILFSSSLIFFTKSFTSPGLEKKKHISNARLMTSPAHALEWIFEIR